MTEHPYRTLPDHCFWQRGIAEMAPPDVDPVIEGKFRIGRADRVATAGSCFAQHMARHLSASGFNHFVTETAHPMIAPGLRERFGYGVYSARYGNLYTSRQLIQLLRRAYGVFVPVDEVWGRPDGRCIDPYRPRIQPDGFASLAEFRADRRRHFSAIRRLVEQLEVFVFTVGLTETWLNREDGAAYPLCPGVAGGEFDPSRHVFQNLRAADVAADLEAAIELIRTKNPQARFILTVSPVPLIATMEPRSVPVSTTYSKSVLRVAAEEVAAGHDYVAYFPSYEVITGDYNRGAYFAVAAAGLQRFPDNADIRIQQAWVALSRRDWDRALEHCTALRRDAADRAEGYAIAAVALRAVGRLDASEELAALALPRFPDDARLAVVHAYAAARQGDWPTAVQRWEQVRQRFPTRLDAFTNGIAVLRRAGRLDEAAALAEVMACRFPAYGPLQSAGDA